MTHRRPGSLPIPSAVDELTAEWLSPVLGPVGAVTAQRIGEGFGLSGHTYRLDVHLADGETRSVVAKLATAAHTARELVFYERCAPSTPIPLPGLVAGSIDEEADHGVLLLDYLADVRQGDVLAGCTIDDAIALARIVGRLHARWWGAGQPALEPFRRLTDRPFHELVEIREGRLERFLERHGKSLPPAMQRVVGTLSPRLGAIQSALRRGPLTLIHGDIHLDNLLFPAQGDPVLIDWQSTTIGPPAVDVARVLVELLATGQRHRHRTDLLTAYNAALANAGIDPPDDLDRQIALALLPLFAGIVNWLGRESPDPPDSRRAALGVDALGNIADAIEVFSTIEAR